jgi:hypothetical protein
MGTKEELIAAAQALAKKLGATRLSERAFRTSVGISRRRFQRHFRSWAELCAQAGLEPIALREPISDDRIFRAMHDAFLAQGGIGTRLETIERLEIGIDTVYRRCGNWTRALIEFAAWARENAPNFPYLPDIERRTLYLTTTKRDVAKYLRPSPSDMPPGPPWRTVGGRLCGDPMHDWPMLHEPINESGVVLAFGMLARDLGFVVDSVAPGFPDCTAKRRVGTKQWESVRIEFEYRSRNFAAHKHDPEGCDLIVCWEHDWPDCPLEVLELRAAVRTP